MEQQKNNLRQDLRYKCDEETWVNLAVCLVGGWKGFGPFMQLKLLLFNGYSFYLFKSQINLSGVEMFYWIHLQYFEWYFSSDFCRKIVSRINSCSIRMKWLQRPLPSMNTSVWSIKSLMFLAKGILHLCLTLSIYGYYTETDKTSKKVSITISGENEKRACIGCAKFKTAKNIHKPPPHETWPLTYQDNFEESWTLHTSICMHTILFERSKKVWSLTIF